MGSNYRGGGTEAKVSMYADDTTLILSDDISIKRSFDLIERYEHASGAKLNQRKTNGIFLGKWKHKSPGPVDISWVTSAQIVGLFYGYQTQTKTNMAEQITPNKRVHQSLGRQRLDHERESRCRQHFHSIQALVHSRGNPAPKGHNQKDRQSDFHLPLGEQNRTCQPDIHVPPPAPLPRGLGVMDIESKVATMQGIHIGNIVSKNKQNGEFWPSIGAGQPCGE